MGKKKDRNAWLDSFMRTRKKVPSPTRIEPAKKGKGAPYRRERIGRDNQLEERE